MLKNLFLNCFTLLLCYSLIAKQSTNDVFTNHQLVSNQINQNVQSGESITLNLGAYGIYQISLQEHNFFSSNYSRENPSKHFTGTIEDYPNANLSLTIQENFVMGYIQLNDEKIFFEPAYFFEDFEQSTDLIVYRENDVIAIETSCAHQYLSANQNRLSENDELNSAMTSCSSYTLEVAMAADYLLYESLGMEEDMVLNLLESINNMSQPSFNNSFSKNIILSLVETNVETSANQFNLSNSLDSETLLADIEVKKSNIWSSIYDIGCFWTSRNLSYLNDSSNAGLANLGTHCRSKALTVNEAYTSDMGRLVKLNAHEIGHVLGAVHDETGSNFIMTSGGSGTTWSPTSVGVINNTLSNNICQCVEGAYQDLSVNCGQIQSFQVNDDQTYLTFTGNVRNNGNQASLATTFKVYLSTDDIVSADDLEIISRDVPSIAAGQSGYIPIQFFNITAASASLPDGIYNLLLQATPNSEDPNTLNNTSDNCYSVSVNNNGTLPYITNVATEGSAFIPGKTLTINWLDNIPNNEDVSIYLVNGTQSYRELLTYSTAADGNVLIFLPYHYNADDNYQFEISYTMDNILKAVGYSNKFSIVTDVNLYNVELSAYNLLAGQQFTVTYETNLEASDEIIAYLYRNDRYFVKTIQTNISATGGATLTLPDGIGNDDNYNILIAYNTSNGTTIAKAVSPRFTINGSLKVNNSALTDEINIAPNPVINLASVNLLISKDKTVDINLYNTAGHLIKKLASNQNFNKGKYNINLDMVSMTSGIYYLTVVENNKTISSKKIIKIQP